jgi:hypothetical protein
MIELQNRLGFLFSTATPKTLGIGALGGFLAFFLSEPLGGRGPTLGFFDAVWGTALWAGAIGVVLGAILLAYDNFSSLRGEWHRDLVPGLPLFFVLGMLGGAAGQIFYSLLRVDALDSIMRAGGWALMGAGIGLGIGTLRRDKTQASRGAMGGFLGGFLGGFVFNFLAAINSEGDGALSRLVGLMALGAAISLGRLVVQEALKTAWLLGISTGPYEGKEAPLTKNRVSVGRDASNDIALFRDETVPPQLGALIFENGSWKWSGENAKIDGIETKNAVLTPNCTIEFGGAKFRFLDRSRQISPQSTPVATITKPISLELHPANPESPWPILKLSPSQKEARIGREPTCDFVLAEATVSSQHARIYESSAGLQLRDNHSTNGTRVNGEKIAPENLVTLRDGDRVAFGKIEYVAKQAT